VSSSDSLAVGTLYQGLRVRDLLSENQLGALYLADHDEHGRVLLRVVKRRVIEGPDELAQVEQDLARLAKVVHRNVARVLHGEENEGEFFYVLEALGTSTLLDLARHCRPFYEREVIWLGRGVSAGLAALHESGLFHGGLLPSAVAVSHHGPIVIDLGWRDRIGSGERYTTEVSQQLDLQALRQLLVFSTSPTGDPQPFSPKLQDLLDRLAPGAPNPFHSAREVSAAFKSHAQRLGLPDPMAPDSLQRLLERYEGVPAPLDASQEGIGLGGGSKLSLPTPTLVPRGMAPLDPGESMDLEHTISDEGPPLTKTGDSSPLSGVSDEALASSESRLGEVSSSLATAGLLASQASDLSTASEATRDTAAYARGMVDSFDPPSVERGAIPVSESQEIEGSAESGRSERGLAPALGEFGPYRLIDELEAGRVSTLFLASHPERTQSLEVRVFLPGLLGEDAPRKRFLRLTQAAKALQHPRVARVVDGGYVQDWAYVVGEQVSGATLREHLKEDERERARAPAIVADALRALEHAHGMGVVHGNIRPSALRIGTDQVTRIVGFGVPRLGKKGRPRPSPYTAPEHREGEGADEAGDIYAMGVMLYQALTGSRPSDASGGPLTGSPPPPSVLCPALPLALDAIVLTAIAEDPAQRYPSAGSFAEDLEHLAGTPRHARPLGGKQRVGRWLAKRGGGVALVGLLAAGVLTVLSGVGAASLLGLRGTTSGGPSAQGSPTQSPGSGSPRPSPTVPGSPVPGSERLKLARLQVERDGYKRQRDSLQGEHRRLEAAHAKLEEELQKAREKAERIQSGQEHERADQVQRLVELGDALMDGGRPRLAERAHRQALAISPNHAGAKAGVRRARQAPGGGTANSDVRARRHMSRAKQHLAGSRFAEARSELLQAHRLGSAEARSLLDRAQEGLLQARMTKRDHDRQVVRRERAAELVAEARRLSDPGRAQARYLEALALDPTSQGARQGLARATPKVAAPANATNERRRDVALQAAEHHASKGRVLYRQLEQDQALDSYFQALHHCSRADALDPRMPIAGKETRRVAAELAAILREDGQANFANQLLRFYGVDPKNAPRVALPLDPHLVVEEADRTSIRRAFGGVVRFEPTRVFDKLRRSIAKKGDRYRIKILVRSKIKPGFPPKVMATGLWIRLEDRQRKTLGAPRRIEFEGGPYWRIVRVDSRGRMIRPFTRSSMLKAEPYVEKARQAVREMLATTKGRK
jgi:serine/threonine protein kinase